MALRSYRFAGRVPRSGPSTTVINAPASGLAGPALRRRAQTDDPATLLRPALADLLDRGGYVDYDDTLDDLLKYV